MRRRRRRLLAGLESCSGARKISFLSNLNISLLPAIVLRNRCAIILSPPGERCQTFAQPCRTSCAESGLESSRGRKKKNSWG
jgi:hypothetical protein